MPPSGKSCWELAWNFGDLTNRILNNSDASTRQPYLHTNPTRRRDDRIYTQLRRVDATAPESTSNPTRRRDSPKIPLKSDASTRQIQHPLKDCQCPGLCLGLQRLLCHSTARLAWRNLNLNAIPRCWGQREGCASSRVPGRTGSQAGPAWFEVLLGLGGNQGGGWGGQGARGHVVFTAKSFGNTLGQAPEVVLKKPMSFLQPSHLETHEA